jgi:anti-sigma B factor antagonist
MALARLQSEAHGNVILACLDGELDLSNVPGISRDLANSVPNWAVRLVLDLSAISYMDSAGLGMLYALARQLGDRQQTLSLIVPASAPLHRLLAVASISTIAQVYPDRQAALAA